MSPSGSRDSSGWLIPAAIVIAGIVIAAGVLISNRGNQEPAAVEVSPAEAVTTVPMAPSPLSSPVRSPSPADSDDAAVQASLTDVLAAAQSLRADTSSYMSATSFDMARLQPSYTYARPTDQSTGPSVISISTAPDTFAAAARSAGGVCFWIKDVNGTQTTFGSGEPCTGITAARASLPAWPIPSPSVTAAPSATP